MVGEMLISGRTCRMLHRIVSRINSGMVDPEKENGRRKPK